MKLLIGDFSSYKAIVLCRYIKKNYHDISVLTYDSRKYTKYIRSKYSDKHFIIDNAMIEQELQRLIKENDIDFLFPVINESIPSILENKVSFGKTLDYIGDLKSYHILNDKSVLFEVAKSLDVKVPEKFEDIASARVPFVVKPTNLSSAKGVKYIFSDDEKPVEMNVDSQIIQEYVEGAGVGYSFYCKEGEILNGYGHKRLSEYPVSGGSSNYRASYVDERMHEMSSKIVRKISYSGFAMFEFKLTENNELYLLEVNPRIWGSVGQGLANNINYFEGILGTSDRIVKKVKEVNTYLSPLIYVSFFKYMLRFNFKPVFEFISNIFKNKPDVSLIRDPKGYVSVILRKL